MKINPYAPIDLRKIIEKDPSEINYFLETRSPYQFIEDVNYLIKILSVDKPEPENELKD